MGYVPYRKGLFRTNLSNCSRMICWETRNDLERWNTLLVSKKNHFSLLSKAKSMLKIVLKIFGISIGHKDLRRRI